MRSIHRVCMYPMLLFCSFIEGIMQQAAHYLIRDDMICPDEIVGTNAVAGPIDAAEMATRVKIVFMFGLLDRKSAQ